ncbi:calmodulin-like protein 4 isoform X1 [Vespa mandarinia]|uniref:calmodulin-like protein 4 isoform X1 n=2 Tax=Vespa TaxID=7443 RepID=UPI00161E8829|nr:calmodulin-like protein 4 isoform X1 [Vespa mandarinia]
MIGCNLERIYILNINITNFTAKYNTYCEIFRLCRIVMSIFVDVTRLTGVCRYLWQFKKNLLWLVTFEKKILMICSITEFRECFYLFARNGQIRTLDELTIIMRSLGLSPTIAELNKYLKDKGGKMSFADFLEAMHLQTRAEDLPKEVIEAFQAADTAHTGTIPARQLAHMLLHWGEKLSNKEVEQIFREANVSINGNVKYEDFVKIACAPVPDYY